MKRHIAAILVPCLLLHLTGCYSFSEISMEEFKSETTDSDIKVLTNDSSFYEIESGHYQIHNDSLFYMGYYYQGDRTKVTFNDKILLENIKSIESECLNLTLTLLTIAGIGFLLYLTVLTVIGALWIGSIDWDFTNK